MPFKSLSQLRLSYSKHNPRWNSDEWLSKTPSVCCLPERKNSTPRSKARCRKVGERIKGPIQTGPRGGKYFTITEKDSKGVICEVKVYLSGSSRK